MAAENTIGTAYIQILPSTKGIASSISSQLRPEASAAGTAVGATLANTMGTSLSSKFKAIGKSVMATGAKMTAVGAGLVVFGKKMIDLANTQKAAETKLTEIYKTRMGASSSAAKGTMKLASELQKVGVVGDEVTLSGAQQLATFAKYPSTINKLLPSMDNLLVQQKGLNGTAEDAKNIGNLMGKAMQGNVGALKRVGITFTDAQAKVMKYGTEEQRAAMLSKIITDNVGNMNSVFAKTDAGKIQQAKNALGDVGEKVGGVILPALAKVAQWLTANVLPKVEALVNFVQAHPIISKIALSITALLAVGGPLLIFIGSLITAVGALTAVNWAAMAPFLPLIAVIAALIAVGVLLAKNWDKIKAAASVVWNSIKAAIVNPIRVALSVVKTVFNGIKTVITAVMKFVTAYVKSKIVLIKAAFSLLSGALAIVVNVFNAIKNAAMKPITWLVSHIKAAINKIKSFFNITLKFKGIKLPHIGIHWKTSGAIAKIASKLGLPGVPAFSVSWYKTGGIFDQPTLAGIGEAGPEAVVPLNALWSRIDTMNANLKNAKGGTDIDYDKLADAVLTGAEGMAIEVDKRKFGKIVRKGAVGAI